jgi:hypothetical protein
MKRIVVLGCQRSGTNIVSACLAHDLNLPLFNERELGYSSCSLTFGDHSVLIEFMNNTKEFVLQAPSLNVYAELINNWLDEPVTFYWVNRDSDEIRASRDRVDWSGEGKESAKYAKEFAWFFNDKYCTDSVDMAKMVWNRYQSRLVDHIEVEYNDFKTHPLWKTERDAIGIGEI